MAIRALEYHGDGTYYLRDPADELAGLRDGPAGRVIVGPRQAPVAGLVTLLRDAADDRTGVVDLVIAAPKPVSLLLALEPETSAAALVALHARSVDDAVGFLAEESGIAGIRAVGFTHGVNRSLDPHLHTHVLVTADRPVAGIRRSLGAADALYLASLRDGLPGACGRVAWLTSRSTTLVEGVDLGLVADASVARDRAGRVERGGHKRLPTRDEARRHWRALVERSCLGVDAGRPPPASTSIDEGRFARELGEGLVSRRDVLRAYATSCARGARAADVRDVVAGLFPGLASGRLHVAKVRDAPGVTVLGPRPASPAGLRSWSAGRSALSAYLEQGHALRHALDPTGATARTRLAVAQLDASLARLGRDPIAAVRARGGGPSRSIS